LIAGLSVLFAGLRRLLPQGWAIVPTLAFPAVLDNLGHGRLLGVGLAHRAMWRSATKGSTVSAVQPRIFRRKRRCVAHSR